MKQKTPLRNSRNTVHVRRNLCGRQTKRALISTLMALFLFLSAAVLPMTQTLPAKADSIDELMAQLDTPISATDEETYMGMTMEPNGLSEEDGLVTTWKGENPWLAEWTWNENTKSKPRVKTDTPIYGIDVSRWNGTIDWNAVVEDGYEFAIVKIGGRYLSLSGDASLYEDPMYKKNIEGAKKAGLKVGAYFWCSAVNEYEARQEAIYALSLIKNYTLDLPLYYDYEWARDGNHRLAIPQTVENRMKVVQTFMDTVQAYGYTSGVYASDSMLIPTGFTDNRGERTGLDGAQLCLYYRIWAARYGTETPGKFCQCVYDIWQYSSKGAVNGINGNVDLNRFFSDGRSQGGSYSDSTSKIDTKPMYRLYNPYSREHLYTADANERDTLVKRGWQNEGIAWYAPVSSKTPVYRLYNKYSYEHFYTTDAYERSVLIKNGWNDEGIGWYSDDGKGVPVYRAFHPKLPATGCHHFTADTYEYGVITSKAGGWTAEGIAWYGVNAARRK